MTTNTVTDRRLALITNMCGGDADTATEILKTETETGLPQFHTCDECNRYCYTGGTLYPDGFTCVDCDDETEDEDEEEEEEEEEPLPINAATLYMYRLCSQEFDEWDEYDGDEEYIREFWQKTLRACSDKYDEKWFAIIATPAI